MSPVCAARRPSAIRLLRHVERRRGVGLRTGRQRAADRQRLAVDRQCLGLVADLRRQIAQLEVRIPHRAARGPIGLTLEQAFELAVEVGGALAAACRGAA